MPSQANLDDNRHFGNTRQTLVQDFSLFAKQLTMQGIITEPKDIFGELVTSRENGNVIGIWAASLGTGLYMCAVENILDDEVEHDKVIILKEKDVNGIPLQAHVLFLQEIEKVYPFKTVYGEPIERISHVVGHH